MGLKAQCFSNFQTDFSVHLDWEPGWLRLEVYGGFWTQLVGPLPCPIKAAGQPWSLVQHGPRAPGPGTCSAVLSSPILPPCLHPAFCNHLSPFINFYWSIIALQCCVSSSYTAKWGFPHSSVHKESVYSAGDPGSIPGSGRSPGERNGNPLQYPYLENPIDRGAWWAAVHGVAKNRARLSN